MGVRDIEQNRFSGSFDTGGETGCLRLAIVNASTVKLCDYRKGTASNCIRLRTVSPIHIWQTGHGILRSQTVVKYIGKESRYRPPRLQRILLRLQKYNITVVYKPGKELIIPDTLSRAHLNKIAEEIPEDEINAQIHMVYANCLDVRDLEKIKVATREDKTLSEIKQYILDGWPEQKKILSERCILRIGENSRC